MTAGSGSASPEADSGEVLSAGQVLAGRYEILACAGHGGMSVVYKVHDRLLDRTVAVKMLHGQALQSPEAIKRFQQEARALSTLDHPNIVKVYQFGINEKGRPYMVSDFLAGIALSRAIECGGSMEALRAVAIFQQVCAAVGHAHEKGILHRDLKPGNVILVDCEQGSDFVKVVDFGIAKILPSAGRDSQDLTQTGTVFGSPFYMSPEQCVGKPVDERSDIYALGCLMYEVLSGKRPFVGGSHFETMGKHLSDCPKPLPENVNSCLEDIVLKCLEKEPANRFQSIKDLSDALCAVSLESRPRKKRDGEKRRLDKRLLINGLVIVAVASAALAFIGRLAGPAQDKFALAEAYAGDARRHFDSRKYAEALSELDHCLSLEPGCAEALLLRGETRVKLNRCAEAVCDLDLAISLKPGCALAYRERGKAYSGLKKYDLAAKDLETAIKLDPADITSLDAYASTCESLGKMDTALSVAGEMIKRWPKQADGYSRRGQLYYDMGKYRLSIADMTSALGRLSRYGTSYYYRGMSYFQLKEYRKALPEFTTSIGLESVYVDAKLSAPAKLGEMYFYRARTHEKLNEKELAASDFRKAYQLGYRAPRV